MSDKKIFWGEQNNSSYLIVQRNQPKYYVLSENPQSTEFANSLSAWPVDTICFPYNPTQQSIKSNRFRVKVPLNQFPATDFNRSNFHLQRAHKKSIPPKLIKFRGITRRPARWKQIGLRSPSIAGRWQVRKLVFTPPLTHTQTHTRSGGGATYLLLLAK